MVHGGLLNSRVIDQMSPFRILHRECGMEVVDWVG